MKIRNDHERMVAAPPERIAALIADFGRVWPTQIAPAPQRQGHRLYNAGVMVGEEFARPAPRARSAWSGRLSCKASTGSSWNLPKVRRLSAIPSRDARPGSTR